MIDSTFDEISQLVSETGADTEVSPVGPASVVSIGEPGAAGLWMAPYAGASGAVPSRSSAWSTTPPHGDFVRIKSALGPIALDAVVPEGYPYRAPVLVGHHWLPVSATGVNGIFVGSADRPTSKSCWVLAPHFGSWSLFSPTSLDIDPSPSRTIAVSRDVRTLGTARWLPAVIDHMNKLLRLRPGWDSYAAKPPSATFMLEALRFLLRVMADNTQAPTIVPLSEGGVQLEWHRAGVDVEVLFADSDEDGLYLHDVATGQEWEGAPIEGFLRFDLGRRLQSSTPTGTLVTGA